MKGSRMDRRSFLKSAGGAIVLGGSVGSAKAGAASSSTPLIKVTWHGASTMQLEFNGLTFLTDPCFGEGDEAFVMGDPNEMFDLAKGPNVKPHGRRTPLRRAKLKVPDHVILSHAHEDHFDQRAARELSKDVPFILPPFDVKKINDMGFTALDPLDWGEVRSFAAGNGKVEITALPAFHSENAEIAKILGKGNGYWISFSQGDWMRSLYWTGDSFGTKQVIETTSAMGIPDLMVAHMGGVGTTGPLGKISMEAEDLLPFAAAIKPTQVLAIHHTTYDLYLEPIAKLMAKNEHGALPLDVIASGSTILLE